MTPTKWLSRLWYFWSTQKRVRRGHDGLDRTLELPRVQQRVGDFRNIHGEPAHLLDDLKDGVQGPQAIGQLHSLRPEDVVRGLECHVGLLLGVDALHQLAVTHLQPADLVRQILQLLLLPHPGPPRRFAVRQHPLPLPLVDGRVSRVRVRSRTRRSLNRRH